MTFRRRARVAALLLAIGVAWPGTAFAQESHHAGPVFSHRDLAILGGASVGAGLLSLFDVRVARVFAESSLHANRRFNSAAKRTSAVTETLLMLSGSGVWALSRLGHNPGSADVALHTTESVAAGAAFIQIIRGIGGRARPYVVTDSGDTRDSDPYEFHWFKGFRSFNYRSFPSMHAMASFAAATALSEEMRLRDTRHRRIVSPLLYLAASASPAARMYLDEHWASDIALGAFLGIFSGQKVVSYSHAHPRNAIDRFFLKPTVSVGVSVGEGRIVPLIR